MFLQNVLLRSLVMLVAVVLPLRATATVTIETVKVGNPGNPADAWSFTSGTVDYIYDIGKYEVTAGQYTEFLNAVAASDTYNLYDARMDLDSGLIDAEFGCNIQRHGVPGSYSYSVASDWANRPVNYVSWGDAARFANWLHHGQPTGLQGLGTTEDGSYVLNGATTRDALDAVTRAAGATWVLPTENEWYKAAYHKNDGVTGNYYEYPIGSNLAPSNQLVHPDPGNNANFGIYPNSSYTLGGPYWRTEVGEFEHSASPYGTFDQGGNVWEWNETLLELPNDEVGRGLRGGGYRLFAFAGGGLDALSQGVRDATVATPDHGFRLALVPEPTSLFPLVIGVMVMGRRRGRRHRTPQQGSYDERS